MENIVSFHKTSSKETKHYSVKTKNPFHINRHLTNKKHVTHHRTHNIESKYPHHKPHNIPTNHHVTVHKTIIKETSRPFHITKHVTKIHHVFPKHGKHTQTVHKIIIKETKHVSQIHPFHKTQHVRKNKHVTHHKKHTLQSKYPHHKPHKMHTKHHVNIHKTVKMGLHPFHKIPQATKIHHMKPHKTHIAQRKHFKNKHHYGKHHYPIHKTTTKTTMHTFKTRLHVTKKHHATKKHLASKKKHIAKYHIVLPNPILPSHKPNHRKHHVSFHKTSSKETKHYSVKTKNPFHINRQLTNKKHVAHHRKHNIESKYPHHKPHYIPTNHHVTVHKTIIKETSHPFHITKHVTKIHHVFPQYGKHTQTVHKIIIKETKHVSQIHPFHKTQHKNEHVTHHKKHSFQSKYHLTTKKTDNHQRTHLKKLKSHRGKHVHIQKISIEKTKQAPINHVTSKKQKPHPGHIKHYVSIRKTITEERNHPLKTNHIVSTKYHITKFKKPSPKSKSVRHKSQHGTSHVIVHKTIIRETYHPISKTRKFTKKHYITQHIMPFVKSKQGKLKKKVPFKSKVHRVNIESKAFLTHKIRNGGDKIGHSGIHKSTLRKIIHKLRKLHHIKHTNRKQKQRTIVPKLVMVSKKTITIPHRQTHTNHISMAHISEISPKIKHIHTQRKGKIHIGHEAFVNQAHIKKINLSTIDTKVVNSVQITGINTPGVQKVDVHHVVTTLPKTPKIIINKLNAQNIKINELHLKRVSVPKRHGFVFGKKLNKHVIEKIHRHSKLLPKYHRIQKYKIGSANIRISKHHPTGVSLPKEHGIPKPGIIAAPNFRRKPLSPKTVKFPTHHKKMKKHKVVLQTKHVHPKKITIHNVHKGAPVLKKTIVHKNIVSSINNKFINGKYTATPYTVSKSQTLRRVQDIHVQPKEVNYPATNGINVRKSTFRLYGGGSENYGIAEYFDAERKRWGAICESRGMRFTEWADVLCLSLGYDKAEGIQHASVRKFSRTGPGCSKG